MIEESFREKRDAGRKLLVPYLTGGYRDDWTDVLRAMADAGADAIEVGIPFSDPLMDGPVIQEATRLALEQGATPRSVVAALAAVDAGVPLVAMTSYNLCFHAGHERFAQMLAGAGVSGAILPDLPYDEADGWLAAAGDAGVETVLLAAPTTPDARLVEICARSRGWVYAVALLGVTGERASVASSAAELAGRVRATTDLPVLVGVGISNAEQAAEVCEYADGAIVGTAVVRRTLEGASPEEVGAFVADLRAGIDSGGS
ncbi:MAG TPA: tryptophan synthase subunit alpha [Acidimicrobiales bacterium]